MNAFLWCERPVAFKSGETVAAALRQADIIVLSNAGLGGVQGRVFCGIGACQACLVSDRGGAPFEACLTPARASMRLAPVSATMDQN